MENLGRLFASMLMANRKYVDPTSVLRSLTDDFGHPISIGEQRDIGEFLLNFIERIEEGLGELKKQPAGKAAGESPERVSEFGFE